MLTPRSSIRLLPALLAAALAACGGDDAAARADEAPGAAGAVYTSEVESVSRWIQQGGGNADSAGLVAAPNPRGEGILVYSRSADSASGGERAAWVVVDSQVVPLNQAGRRAAPQRAAARDDERTWERIGIKRTDGDADLRDILPVPDAPPARERPAPREAPRVPAPDSSAPVPFPDPTPTPRVTGPRDTLRVPAGRAPSAQTPARRDSTAREPADTLRIPAAGRPVRDTVRVPGPSAPEAAPEPTAPATPAPALPGA
jgi:hypothetical protein